MAWKSSPTRYGRLPIAIHWLSALAILVMLTSGLAAAGAADDSARLGTLKVHVGIGVCVLVLTLLRILWWLFADRKPTSAADLPGWQALISRFVHYGLYAVILVMLASGVALAALTGLVPLLLGTPGPLPDFTILPPFRAHGAGAGLLIALASLHIAAALYHQFWRRDRLLARMGIGR